MKTRLSSGLSNASTVMTMRLVPGSNAREVGVHGWLMRSGSHVELSNEVKSDLVYTRAGIGPPAAQKTCGEGMGGRRQQSAARGGGVWTSGRLVHSFVASVTTSARGRAEAG